MLPGGGGVGKGIAGFEVRSVSSSIEATNSHAAIAQKVRGNSQTAPVMSTANMFDPLGLNDPDRKLLGLITDALRDVTRQRSSKDLRSSVEDQVSQVTGQQQPAKLEAHEDLLGRDRKLQQNVDLNDAFREVNRRKGQSAATTNVNSLVDDIEGKPKPAKINNAPVFQLDGGQFDGGRKLF